MNAFVKSTLVCALVGSFASLDCRGATLVNPDFETGDFTGWTAPGGFRIGGGADNHTPAGDSGAVFDAFTHTGLGFYVLHQELAAVEGQLWEVSAWIRSVNFDGSTLAWLEVQFWDGTDTFIPGSQVQSGPVNSDQPFTQYTLSATAPENTAKISVRGVVQVQSAPSDTNFPIFDDFSAQAVVPEPSSMALLLCGSVLIAAARRRHRSAQRTV